MPVQHMAGGADSAPRIFVRDRSGPVKSKVPSRVVQQAKAGGRVQVSAAVAATGNAAVTLRAPAPTQGAATDTLRSLQLEAALESDAAAREKRAARAQRRAARFAATGPGLAQQLATEGSPGTEPPGPAPTPTPSAWATTMQGLSKSALRGFSSSLPLGSTGPQSPLTTRAATAGPHGTTAGPGRSGLRTGGLHATSSSRAGGSAPQGSLRSAQSGPPPRTSSPALGDTSPPLRHRAVPWRGGGVRTGPLATHAEAELPDTLAAVQQGGGDLLASYRSRGDGTSPGGQQGQGPDAGMDAVSRMRLLASSNKACVVARQELEQPRTLQVPARAARSGGGVGLPRKVDALNTPADVLKFKWGYSDAQIRRMRRQQEQERDRRRAYLSQRASLSAEEVQARKEQYFRAKTSAAEARDQKAELEFKRNLRHLERAHGIAAEFEEKHIKPFEEGEKQRKQRLLADWSAKVYEPMQTAVNQHVTRKPLADIVAGRAAQLQEYLDVTNTRAVFSSTRDPTYNPKLDKAEHTVRVPRLVDPLKQQLGTGGGSRPATPPPTASDEDTLTALRTAAMAGATSTHRAISAGRIALSFGGVPPSAEGGGRQGGDREGGPRRSPSPDGWDGPEGDLADRIRRAHRAAPKHARWTLAPELWHAGVIQDTHYVKTYATLGGGLYAPDHPSVKALAGQQLTQADAHRERVLPDWYDVSGDRAAEVAAEEAVALGKTRRDAQVVAARGGRPRRTSTALQSPGIQQALAATSAPGAPQEGSFASRRPSRGLGDGAHASLGVTQAMRAGERPGTPPPAPGVRVRGDGVQPEALRRGVGAAEAVHVGSHPTTTAKLSGFHAPPRGGGGTVRSRSPEVQAALSVSANVSSEAFAASLPKPRRSKATHPIAQRVSSSVSANMSQVMASDARPGEPQAEFKFQRRQASGPGHSRLSTGALGALQPPADTQQGGYDTATASAQPGTHVQLSLSTRRSGNLDRFG